MFDMFFHRRKEVRISGDHVDLIVREDRKGRANEEYDRLVRFRIVLHGTHVFAGECDLRVGMNRVLYYAGNIGYRIFEGYRGHGYAYEAAEMVLRYAFETVGMMQVIITCSPENTASKKTIERLGGTLLETVKVPDDHWLVQRGEFVKNIYLFTEERGITC
ncbi:MAG: GNAT family N-acetyltransferase [Bulleidia sp.]